MHSNARPSAPAKPIPSPPDMAGAKEIEDFIYLFSHDVRASVRALLELPQWIVEDLEESGVKLEGSVLTSIEMMNRHTGRLDRMLIDLLAFSRVGRMQEMRLNDTNAAIDEVLDEFQLLAGFSIERDIECNSIPMGERDVLTLFQALISNAVKHHDQPTGRVYISTVLEGADIVIRVADDGPGIEAAFQEKVFGAMQTLRARDEVEGSGMGLTTTRKIAMHYGGGAHVAEPMFERGTTIEVRVKNIH